MEPTTEDTGLIAVLIERFETQRLPRALSIKEKVDGGAPLDDFDFAFLEEIYKDSKKIRPLLERHPEYQPLAGRMVSLYKEITEKALENERSG